MTEYNSDINDEQAEKDSHGRRKINCLHCRFFEVTWDQDYPRGCKIFGIKGKDLPSVAVRAATGRDCPSFKPKNQ